LLDDAPPKDHVGRIRIEECVDRVDRVDREGGKFINPESLRKHAALAESMDDAPGRLNTL
jgi:hypothetical protein